MLGLCKVVQWKQLQRSNMILHYLGAQIPVVSHSECPARLPATTVDQVENFALWPSGDCAWANDVQGWKLWCVIDHIRRYSFWRVVGLHIL